MSVRARIATRSLRTRLLVTTIALMALGLLAANVATYALLRSSLFDRVDQGLWDARLAAVRELFEQRDRFPEGFGDRRPDVGDVTGPAALPITFAALVDASGHLVVTQSFGFGSIQPPPVLPEELPGSATRAGGAARATFTTGSAGSSLRYRVLALSLGPQQGTVIVAYQLGDVDATLRRLLLVEGIVTVAVLAGAGAVALWLVRVGLRPLTQMEHAAAGIAAGDLSRRVEPADEETEVGRLGLALNAMLERIEAAFAERSASEARLRRFVADASHELRTPLTSIRGYAELFRHGADVRPEDLEKSMRRIEEESARMGELVDELLLLARLDQGRPLDRAPVDLATIARDAVEDARAVQPGRPIDVDAPEPVVVQGDEARLRQVVANLLSNALRHTPPGTPVRVRARASSGAAVLEVADEGAGLEPSDAERVFDRFFVADPARSRESGGVGLGLSIVAAIVRAHGGSVDVDTAPGAGARFAVRVPVGEPPPRPDESPPRPDGSSPRPDELTP